MSLCSKSLYRAADGTLVSGIERGLAQSQSQDWELRDGREEILTPIPTPETKPPSPSFRHAV